MTDFPQMPRDEAEALLVFLANDTLEGTERAAVEAAVAADPQLQAELEALRSIRNEMQATPAESTSAEFALARLMRDIDREAPQQAPVAQSRTQLWKYAAAAAIALFAAQTAFIAVAPDTVIEMAGGGTDAADGPTLLVAFSADATEGELRALLLSLDLEIAAGPSALGLYTLVARDENSRAAALDRLQSNTRLVDSAELGD